MYVYKSGLVDENTERKRNVNLCESVQTKNSRENMCIVSLI